MNDYVEKAVELIEAFEKVDLSNNAQMKNWCNETVKLLKKIVDSAETASDNDIACLL